MAEETKQSSYYDSAVTHADTSIKSALEKTVYIKHAETEKIWSIAADAAHISTLLKRNILDKTDTDTYGLSDKNPLIVNDINSDAITFIISYLMNIMNLITILLIYYFQIYYKLITKQLSFLIILLFNLII